VGVLDARCCTDDTTSEEFGVLLQRRDDAGDPLG